MKYNDLTVKGGRLINNRPNSITGIQKACKIKKEIKRSEKISTMADAMYEAEMRVEMSESLKGYIR
jgi:hypothetical protein